MNEKLKIGQKIGIVFEAVRHNTEILAIKELGNGATKVEVEIEGEKRWINTKAVVSVQ